MENQTDQQASSKEKQTMKIEDQPPPISNDRPSIHDLVIQDMQDRKQLGLERHGCPLQAHNGRNGLIDLYQELQDATAYVRQEIEEQNDWRELCQEAFQLLRIVPEDDSYDGYKRALQQSVVARDSLSNWGLGK